jgi:F420-dependent oxidoreductase-like protein
MQLALNFGYSGKLLRLPIDMIRQAEQLGYHSAWVAEAWGSDAVSAAAWILAQTSSIKVGTAIMQVPARTPANTAMSAMSLAQLSEGRFILGLGASGPQVVEGWHGVGYRRPLTRLRECIEIVRLIMARGEPVVYSGEIYQIPYTGQDATGLGKPLKSILRAETGIPIYTASFTPAGFRLAGEIADGLLAVFMSPDKMDFMVGEIEKGFARAGGGKGFADFDIAPNVAVQMGDDLDACRLPIKQTLALYIGGMGAKEKNFYNDFAKKMGYTEAAERIQSLYLSGRQREAIATVPDELVDEVALVGPEDRIAERARAWLDKRDYIKTIMFNVRQPEVLPVLKRVFLQ